MLGISFHSNKGLCFFIKGEQFGVMNRDNGVIQNIKIFKSNNRSVLFLSITKQNTRDLQLTVDFYVISKKSSIDET